MVREKCLFLVPLPLVLMHTIQSTFLNTLVVLDVFSVASFSFSTYHWLGLIIFYNSQVSVLLVRSINCTPRIHINLLLIETSYWEASYSLTSGLFHAFYLAAYITNGTRNVSRLYTVQHTNDRWQHKKSSFSILIHSCIQSLFEVSNSVLCHLSIFRFNSCMQLLETSVLFHNCISITFTCHVICVICSVVCCWRLSQLISGTKIMQSNRATNLRTQRACLLVGRNIVIDLVYKV